MFPSSKFRDQQAEPKYGNDSSEYISNREMPSQILNQKMDVSQITNNMYNPSEPVTGRNEDNSFSKSNLYYSQHLN